MEMTPFDFTTILWEYVCQFLLFPFSDENTRAQITWLVHIYLVCKRDWINFSVPVMCRLTTKQNSHLSCFGLDVYWLN